MKLISFRMGVACKFFVRPRELLSPLPTMTLLVLALLLVLAPASQALPPSGGVASDQNKAEQIPPALRPWIPWVQSADPDRNCVKINDAMRCAWPRSLDISVSMRGAEFTLEGTLDRPAEVRLPGGGEVMPTAVRTADGDNVVVSSDDGEPWASLDAGPFRLTGSFSWNEMPKSLVLPPATALVSLTLLGKRVEYPVMDEAGEIWFSETNSPEQAEQDSVQVTVFRKLEDGVPFRIHTRISLRVSGKVRELVLGKILPADSTLVGVESDLAVRVEADRGIVVQARPGEYVIGLETLLQKPPATLALPAWSLADFSGEEIWVWSPSEEFRSVRVSGGTLIDAGRTELPPEWQGLTTIVLSGQESLSFEETRRGEVEAGSNTLSLKRTVWVPLEGEELLVRDQITGSMSRDWRLDASSELHVGRISVSGQDQLITKSKQGDAVGVELRSRAVDVTAESRLAASLGNLPVVSWNHPMERVTVEVNLPPGWEVIHAAGADAVSATWVSSWSLLDLFLVLLASVATLKLVGRTAGALVLAGLILLHQQSGSPQLIYFHLLGAFALLQFLPESGFKNFVRFHYSATLMLFAVLVATFSFHHLVQAVVPSVLPPGENLYGFLEPFFYLVESTFSGWVMFTLFVWGAQLFFRGRFFAGLLYGVIAAALTVVVGLSATFTGLGGSLQPAYFNLDDVQSYADRNSSGSAYIAKRFEEVTDSLGEGYAVGSAPALAPRQKFAQKALQSFDPQAVVQTGPGLPEWRWNMVALIWNGRVEPEYEATLITVGPFGHAVLSFIRVGILLALLLLFIRKSSARWWDSLTVPREAVAAAICAGAALLSAGMGGARVALAEDFPSEVLLGQLGDRLNVDRCRENCATINDIELSIQGRTVSVDIVASSKGAGAVGLPGPFLSLGVDSVLVNGETAAALRREDDGSLWIRVPRGVHRIKVNGTLRSRDVATLQFPMNPQHVSISAPDWEVDGVSATGSVQQSIQLTRKLAAKDVRPADDHAAAEVSSWFSVTRAIAVGLPWEVASTVSRAGNLDRPEMVSLSLLAGESVVTPGMTVSGNKLQVLFQRGVAEVSWGSSLKPADQLVLTADEVARVTESWEIRCSTLWSCSVAGLAPERSVLDEQSGWRFRPFPSESVTLSVYRPLGAPGQSLTIERSRHEITPGVRSLDGLLTLSLRASQGASQRLQLPDGAVLTRVMIDGQEETTRFQGSELKLPVKPGGSQAEVRYSLAREQGLALKVPAVILDGTAANVTTVVKWSTDRWLLLAMGEGFGPAVLFWAKLLVVVLFAVLLGRAGFGPLDTKDWILLGIGIATLPIALMLVPVLWMWLLQRRADRPSASVFRFNLMQISLGVLTLVVLMLLYRAVETGLIFSPDMFVRGKDSSLTQLTWYLDYSEASLPTPTIISVPMWVWRAVMLLWSMWLVFSLLRWLRWAFNSVGQGGLWKSSPPKAVVTSATK